MERMSVADAGLHFADLIDHVCTEGVVVELHRENQVVAHLSPATPTNSPNEVDYVWSTEDYKVLKSVEDFSEHTDAHY